MRTIEGPIIGAAIVTILYLQLARYLGLSLIIEGIILLVIIFLAPKGIVSIFKSKSR
jgi:ABC-type branched-subunit amino acid transport system permease subunit